jgi:tetratricopeptide (TPR) repeat protein
MSVPAAKPESPVDQGPLDEQLELAALRASLELADGFTLLLAVCNQPRRRDELISELARDPNASSVKIIHLDQPIDSLLDELSRRLESAAEKAVFVLGLERSLPNSDEAHRSRLVANLNASRDALARTVARPLVLWIPEYVLHALQRGAPDFYSIHSGVYQFGQPYESAEAFARRTLSVDEDREEGSTAAEKALRIAALERLLSEYEARPADRRDRPAEWALLARLAFCLQRAGRLAEAESAGRRALALAQATFGNDHPKVAACVNNVGSVLRSKGDLDGALRCFREAERIDRAAFGNDHPKVATCVNNVGRVLHDKGDLDGALRCFREAERINRAAFGNDHPHLAYAMNNVGSVLQAKGDLDGALRCFREAERIARAAFGDNHSKVATCVNNVGMVLQDKGDPDGALRCYREAERIDRAAFGNDHPEVAIDVNNIGSVLHAKGDLDGALRCYHEAEQIDRAAFGNDHPNVAIRVNNIGGVLQANGDLDGALRCYREAERIDRAAFGNDHPEVATDVNNVGSILLARGDIEGARAMGKEAFHIAIRHLGPRALDTVQSARNLRAAGLDPIALARDAAGEDAARELAALLDGHHTAFERQ